MRVFVGVFGGHPRNHNPPVINKPRVSLFFSFLHCLSSTSGPADSIHFHPLRLPSALDFASPWAHRDREVPFLPNSSVSCHCQVITSVTPQTNRRSRKSRIFQLLNLRPALVVPLLVQFKPTLAARGQPHPTPKPAVTTDRVPINAQSPVADQRPFRFGHTTDSKNKQARL